MDHLQCSWIMGMRTMCKGPLQCYQITVMRKWCVRTSTVLLNHGDEEVVWGPLQCYWIMVIKLCEDLNSVTESWWWRSGVRTSAVWLNHCDEVVLWGLVVLMNHCDKEVVWGPLQCDWIMVMRKWCEDLRSVTESWWWGSGVQTCVVLLDHGGEEVVRGPLQCYWIMVVRQWYADVHSVTESWQWGTHVKISVVLLNHSDEEVLLNHGGDEVVCGPLQCNWIMTISSSCEDLCSVTESFWWRSGVYIS